MFSLPLFLVVRQALGSPSSVAGHSSRHQYTLTLSMAHHSMSLEETGSQAKQQPVLSFFILFLVKFKYSIHMYVKSLLCLVVKPTFVLALCQRRRRWTGIQKSPPSRKRMGICKACQTSCRSREICHRCISISSLFHFLPLTKDVPSSEISTVFQQLYP